MSTFKFKSTGELNDTLRRIFFLAWQNCGGPLGMGFLQDRPGATENDVWNNVQKRGDYPDLASISAVKQKDGKGSIHADYVFGRMMKLNVDFNFNDLTITMRDDEPRPDYQGWAKRTIKTYDDLALNALTGLNINADIL